MRYFIVFLISLFAFLSVSPVHAIVDPLATPNNKHGVHIVDENDIDDAAKLVNSSGGQWGYVTMVIREDERDIGRWQHVFDRLRENKIIPVIRIATKGTHLGWGRPDESDAQDWVDFFDQLNWVVKNRYIVLFNEPNHASEWEGSIDPKGYAHIARVFHDTFKKSNDDYFILPAGLDQTAGDTSDSASITAYFDEMAQADPDIFTIFDGWTTHAYPNPNFSGSVDADGRKSIRGFDWEVSYLEKYGLASTIPVFITETGWAHSEGISNDSSFKSADEVALLYEKAFQYAWSDERIVMVSPFLLNYQSDPFDNFSWKKPGSFAFYPQYYSVLGLSKENGLPIQIDTAEAAVEAQAAKTYTITISTESNLKTDVGAVTSQLRLDLSATHKLVVDAKQAVQALRKDNAIMKKEARDSANL